MLARFSRKLATCFLGSSVFSASAATIFDLVIGFAIESILLSPCCGGSFEKAGHSTCGPQSAVNMISHSIDGLSAIWGDYRMVGRTRFTRARRDLEG